MIQEFVDRYMNRKSELESIFSKKHPNDYKEIVTKVIELISGGTISYQNPDYTNIHEIDDGDYQGTLLYIIPSGDYQPDSYWYVMVGYGSCSGCDTLEGIWGDDDKLPDKQQVEDYMTLALHIVQGIKVLEE